LNQRLLEIHAAGERAVLIIDEAQNMSRETLEQVRLLTNLETSTDKLLQIILLGQPELRELLSRPSLRQLAQRITARYHLAPLSQRETVAYVRHRIQIAGGARCPFTSSALRTLHRVAGGVPRLINIIADRSLMAGYSREADKITPAMVRKAAGEVVVGDESGGHRGLTTALSVLAVVVVLAVAGGMIWSLSSVPEQTEEVSQPLWRTMLAGSSESLAWREAAALFPGADPALIERACSEGQYEGFACHRLRGSWALLRKLDRPVVLRLEQPRGGHLMAVEVGSSSVLARQSGQDFQVPIAQLDARWLGDFYALWPDRGSVWQAGDTDLAIAELKRLAALDPEQPWDGPVDEQYGPEFRTWIRDFQARNGLRQDGMAGPVTRL
ncbi:MAG: AAA family ATPase, partial [Wenzhouxiangellaceae bacterium]